MYQEELGLRAVRRTFGGQAWIFGLTVVSALSCSMGLQSKLWVRVMPLFLLVADNGKL